jgi:hypothetical protein
VREYFRDSGQADSTDRKTGLIVPQLDEQVPML